MDATFWVGISFCLFVFLLVYKKVPGIINNVLEGKITEIKNKIEDAENLKKESNHLLGKYQKQLDESKKECEEILQRALKINENDNSAMEEKMNSMMILKEKNINEKINQAKNGAIKEMKKVATIIAVESAKKIITQTIDKEKIDSINYTSIQENLESLKKDI
jgi:F-type H+-transporting ATPase subunit b